MSRCIDADVILTKFDKALQLAGNDGAIAALKFCKEIVQKAPTVSPDEVRGAGKWTQHVLKNANTPWGYDCSACGEWFVIGDDTAERYNYCPNCGAKMEVSE